MSECNCDHPKPMIGEKLPCPIHINRSDTSDVVDHISENIRLKQRIAELEAELAQQKLRYESRLDSLIFDDRH